jgi:two-component system, NtrC family, sensor histidine kinase KinB
MKAYRHSTNLKLSLILFAVLIALASLFYTNRLAERLREREQFVIELWAAAQEQIATSIMPVNPHRQDFEALQGLVTELGEGDSVVSAEEAAAFEEALAWAESMPPSGDVTLAGEILREGGFGIPAVIIDSSDGDPRVQFWQNITVPPDSVRARQQLLDRAVDMAGQYQPIPIEIDFGSSQLKQYIFYDESQLIRELRIFPYVQLLFIGLFVVAGYLGFSYVRSSEQSGLWVGMAREAAHQLGTPISSLMGWHELLKEEQLSEEQRRTALDEVENDIERLNRVASRFSDIGSLPKLEVMPVAAVIQDMAAYMRRRMPQQSRQVLLNVSVPSGIKAPLNPELFEWVIENLIKNALDAIEAKEGKIDISARSVDGKIRIDISDTGKGIDRSQWKYIFRPGYSTKKRGWGLGLSLAKRIVEDYHGGSLSLAQSRLGQGTTFRIELPAAEAA